MVSDGVDIVDKHISNMRTDLCTMCTYGYDVAGSTLDGFGAVFTRTLMELSGSVRCRLVRQHCAYRTTISIDSYEYV